MIHDEINKIICLAKSINELVEAIATEEVTRTDIEELEPISPGITNLITGLEKWVFNVPDVIDVIKEKPAPVEDNPAPVNPVKRNNRPRRVSIPDNDIIKIAKIICSMTPDEGIKVDNAFCKQVSNKVAESKLDKYISSKMVIPRLVHQLTYKKITSKYYTFEREKGMLFKKK